MDGTIEERLREIVARQLNVHPELVTREVVLTSGLGADSLDMVELVMAAEEEFKAELGEAGIPQAVEDELITFGKFVDYLQSRAD